MTATYWLWQTVYHLVTADQTRDGFSALNIWIVTKSLISVWDICLNLDKEILGAWVRQRKLVSRERKIKDTQRKSDSMREAVSKVFQSPPKNVALNLMQYFSPDCKLSIFIKLLQIGFCHLQTKELCVCVYHRPYHFVLNQSVCHFSPLNWNFLKFTDLFLPMPHTYHMSGTESSVTIQWMDEE